MNATQRDKAWGRFYGRKGAARVFREAEQAPTLRQRLARFLVLYSGLPLECTLPKRHETGAERAERYRRAAAQSRKEQSSIRSGGLTNQDANE